MRTEASPETVKKVLFTTLDTLRDYLSDIVIVGGWVGAPNLCLERGVGRDRGPFIRRGRGSGRQTSAARLKKHRDHDGSGGLFGRDLRLRCSD